MTTTTIIIKRVVGIVWSTFEIVVENELIARPSDCTTEKTNENESPLRRVTRFKRVCRRNTARDRQTVSSRDPTVQARQRR